MNANLTDLIRHPTGEPSQPGGNYQKLKNCLRWRTRSAAGCTSNGILKRP